MFELCDANAEMRRQWNAFSTSTKDFINIRNEKWKEWTLQNRPSLSEAMSAPFNSKAYLRHLNYQQRDSGSTELEVFNNFKFYFYG